MRLIAGTIRLAPSNNMVVWGAADGTGSAAGRRSERAYSAAIVCGLKSMPSALATPAP
jgi:hypothetical protein